MKVLLTFLAFTIDKLSCFGFNDAGKVYFMQGHYDVKLQADNRVRWDVVLRD